MSTQDNTSLATTYDEFDSWEEKSHDSQYKKMKEIRFCGSLSKRALQEDIKEGNFFLFDPNTPAGDEPILTDLGQSVNFVFIRDTKRLEVYEEYNGKDMYTVTSSEFRDNDDLIFLYDRTVTDGNNEIVALLPYINFIDDTKSIKHLKNTRYGKRLRTRYLAYCLWFPENGGDPEVVQMGFTATDNTGCARNEFKPLGFDSYAQDSFLGLKSAASKIVANKLFVHHVNVFSKPAYKVTVKGEEKDSKDRIKGFSIIGQITDEQKPVVQEALKFVREYLQNKYTAKSLKAYANTIDKEAIISLDARHIPLMIGCPGMLMGYEPIPAIESVAIPQLDIPRSDRAHQSSESDELPFERRETKFVDVRVAEEAKSKPKSREEAIAKKREETEAIKNDAGVEALSGSVRKMHDDLKNEQDAKMKEVDDVFGN